MLGRDQERRPAGCCSRPRISTLVPAITRRSHREDRAQTFTRPDEDPPRQHERRDQDDHPQDEVDVEGDVEEQGAEDEHGSRQRKAEPRGSADGATLMRFGDVCSARAARRRPADRARPPLHEVRGRGALRVGLETGPDPDRAGTSRIRRSSTRAVGRIVPPVVRIDGGARPGRGPSARSAGRGRVPPGCAACGSSRSPR